MCSMAVHYPPMHATALLLEKEPTNLQAQSLDSLIQERLTKGADPLFIPLNHRTMS
jgi:hypothetical protein